MAASSSFLWTLNQEKWVSLRKCTLVLCIYDLLYLVILPGLLLKHWGFINDLDLNPINSGHHRTLLFVFLFAVCLWSCFAFVLGQFSKRGDNYKVTVSFKPGSRLSFGFHQNQQKSALMGPVDGIQRESFVFPLVCKTKRWPLLTVLELASTEIEFWSSRTLLRLQEKAWERKVCMCEHLHLIRFEFFAAFQDNIVHECACFTLTDSEIRLCEELLSFLIWDNLPLIHLSPTQFWFKFSGPSPTQHLWGSNPGFTLILRCTILDFPSLKRQSGGSEGHTARGDNKDIHT